MLLFVFLLLKKQIVYSLPALLYLTAEKMSKSGPPNSILFIPASSRYNKDITIIGARQGGAPAHPGRNRKTKEFPQDLLATGLEGNGKRAGLALLF